MCSWLHLGLGKKYRHNLYLHGPYSQLLSRDYKAANGEIADGGADPDFDRNAVLEIMSNGGDWLDLATILVDLAEEDESMTGPDSLVRRTVAVKYLYPKGDIEAVLQDLRTTPLAGVFDRLVWPTGST